MVPTRANHSAHPLGSAGGGHFGRSVSIYDLTFSAGAGFSDLALALPGAVYVYGPYVPSSINSQVWVDADQDGVQDAGESPMIGIEVRLLDEDLTEVETIVTSDNGTFTFTRYRSW